MMVVLGRSRERSFLMEKPTGLAVGGLFAVYPALPASTVPKGSTTSQ